MPHYMGQARSILRQNDRWYALRNRL